MKLNRTIITGTVCVMTILMSCSDEFRAKHRRRQPERGGPGVWSYCTTLPVKGTNFRETKRVCFYCYQTDIECQEYAQGQTEVNRYGWFDPYYYVVQ